LLIDEHDIQLIHRTTRIQSIHDVASTSVKISRGEEESISIRSRLGVLVVETTICRSPNSHTLHPSQRLHIAVSRLRDAVFVGWWRSFIEDDLFDDFVENLHRELGQARHSGRVDLLTFSAVGV
jgi:hypothetical protein